LKNYQSTNTQWYSAVLCSGNIIRHNNEVTVYNSPRNPTKFLSWR